MSETMMERDARLQQEWEARKRNIKRALSSKIYREKGQPHQLMRRRKGDFIGRRLQRDGKPDLLNARITLKDLQFKANFVGRYDLAELLAAPMLSLLKTDVQAWNKWKAEWDKKCIHNFMEINFAGANLAGTQLKDANLAGTQLKGANLAGANLAGANLEEAWLEDANLAGANLAGANLEETFLQDANLAGANLAGANLDRVDLCGANLEGANLEGAKLHEVELIGANLTSANLAGASLVNIGFQRANLAYANLEESSIEFISLDGANLAGASLRNAFLNNLHMDTHELETLISASCYTGLRVGEDCYRLETDPYKEISIVHRLEDLAKLEQLSLF